MRRITQQLLKTIECRSAAVLGITFGAALILREAEQRRRAPFVELGVEPPSYALQNTLAAFDFTDEEQAGLLLFDKFWGAAIPLTAIAADDESMWAKELNSLMQAHWMRKTKERQQIKVAKSRPFLTQPNPMLTAAKTLSMLGDQRPEVTAGEYKFLIKGATYGAMKTWVGMALDGILSGELPMPSAIIAAPGERKLFKSELALPAFKANPALKTEADAFEQVVREYLADEKYKTLWPLLKATERPGVSARSGNNARAVTVDTMKLVAEHYCGENIVLVSTSPYCRRAKDIAGRELPSCRVQVYIKETKPTAFAESPSAAETKSFAYFVATAADELARRTYYLLPTVLATIKRNRDPIAEAFADYPLLATALSTSCAGGP